MACCYNVPTPAADITTFLSHTRLLDQTLIVHSVAPAVGVTAVAAKTAICSVLAAGTRGPTIVLHRARAVDRSSCRWIFGRDFYSFMFTTRSVVIVHQGGRLLYSFNRMSMIFVLQLASGPFCGGGNNLRLTHHAPRRVWAGGSKTNERGRDVSVGYVRSIFLSRSNDHVLQRAGRHGNNK